MEKNPLNNNCPKFVPVDQKPLKKIIENILKIYTERKDKIDYVSRLVSNAEVAANDYNLSVSSYVEAQDTREVIDIKVLNAQIKEIVEKEQVLRTQIDQIVAEIEG